MTLIFGLSEVSGLEIGVVKLLSIFRRKVLGLLVLAIICIVTEQVIYCVITPTYLFQLLVSPVFWGSLSLVCFASVWRMDKQYPQPKKLEHDLAEREPRTCECGYHPIWDNPLNIMNPVYIFRHTGE